MPPRLRRDDNMNSSSIPINCTLHKPVKMARNACMPNQLTSDEARFWIAAVFVLGLWICVVINPIAALPTIALIDHIVKSG